MIKKWKEISQRAMEFQAKVLLFIIYFTILAPIAIWFRMTHDVLAEKSVKSNWKIWLHNNKDLVGM